MAQAKQRAYIYDDLDLNFMFPATNVASSIQTLLGCDALQSVRVVVSLSPYYLLSGSKTL